MLFVCVKVFTQQGYEPAHSVQPTEAFKKNCDLALSIEECAEALTFHLLADTLGQITNARVERGGGGGGGVASRPLLCTGNG